MSARRRECCIERLNGVPGYRLVDTTLLHFILWEVGQCCIYGEIKIVVEKPDCWRVSFGRTDDKVKITVNDRRCTDLMWNEFARYVQWLCLQGTRVYFDCSCIEQVIFPGEHNDCQLVKMTGLCGAGSRIG
jgi:hypothetical protein